MQDDSSTLTADVNMQVTNLNLAGGTITGAGDIYVFRNFTLKNTYNNPTIAATAPKTPSSVQLGTVALREFVVMAPGVASFSSSGFTFSGRIFRVYGQAVAPMSSTMNLYGGAVFSMEAGSSLKVTAAFSTNPSASALCLSYGLSAAVQSDGYGVLQLFSPTSVLHGGSLTSWASVNIQNSVFLYPSASLVLTQSSATNAPQYVSPFFSRVGFVLSICLNFMVFCAGGVNRCGCCPTIQVSH